MPDEIVIEVENLTKRFGPVEALRNLSFKVPEGVAGLIGPNGAGKTTTIKILMGLLRPDEGNAEVFGLNCWKDSLKIRGKIGFLPEKAAFYDHMTGLDYLILISELKGLQNSRNEASKALSLVELESEAQNRRVREYSAGMRQRLGLAQALLGTPELVILDEPTSNLDPLGRIQFLDVINKLSKEAGVAFLISSHILPELEKVCDYVVLMDKGRALKAGSLNQLLSKITTSTFRMKVQPKEKFVELLKREAYVRSLWLEKDLVFVVVGEVEDFKRRLPVLLLEAQASLEELEVEGKSLESLFKTSLGG